jgi:hypothetical protein
MTFAGEFPVALSQSSEPLVLASLSLCRRYDGILSSYTRSVVVSYAVVVFAKLILLQMASGEQVGAFTLAGP